MELVGWHKTVQNERFNDVAPNWAKFDAQNSSKRWSSTLLTCSFLRSRRSSNTPWFFGAKWAVRSELVRWRIFFHLPIPSFTLKITKDRLHKRKNTYKKGGHIVAAAIQTPTSKIFKVLLRKEGHPSRSPPWVPALPVDLRWPWVPWNGSDVRWFSPSQPTALWRPEASQLFGWPSTASRHGSRNSFVVQIPRQSLGRELVWPHLSMNPRWIG